MDRRVQGGPHGRRGARREMGDQRRQGPEEQPGGEGHPELRFHAGSRPLQGPSPGRIRRSNEAAVHRMRVPRGEGADPLGRGLRRPHQGMGCARGLGQIPRGHGRRRGQRDEALRWQDCLRERDEEPVRGLQLRDASGSPCMHDIGILSSLDPVAID